MDSSRCSSARRTTYRLRLLGGGVGSLALVLVLVHLPIETSAPRVGWAMMERMPQIEIQEVRSETSETPPDASVPKGSIPTRHAAPGRTANATASGSAASPSSGPTASASASADAPNRPPLTSIAQLAPEEQPRIMGGMGALYLNIEYPRAARDQGIEGRLFLTFTVRPDGRTEDIRVRKPLHPLCDSAAVRAVRSVRFAPGRQEGRAVPVRMTLPVRFQLTRTSGSAATASGGR